MSLNGLDESKVIEAHELAAAEPGGWFLLKYASRDEVELSGRGNGGLTEIRDAVAAYNEESPLYGFLRYRRRNVLIKYLPEDCSRLIRARVAVHFNAICERFSPYDTIFEISTAAELRDTKLSAACQLHAASNSTSSSTSSLRRRRLVEIAEEDEEDQRALKRQSLVPNSETERPQTPADKTIPSEPVLLNSDLATSPEATRFSSNTTSEVPNFGAGRDGPTSPARSARSIDPDSCNYSPHPTGKPRVKLGPRPSQADSTIRPQTAGNFKPVSTIPAGVKLFGKGAKKVKSKEAKDGDKEREKGKARDGIPAAAAADLSQNDLPARDRAHTIQDDAGSLIRLDSSTSLASLAPASVPTKPTITPEKARLMKAMQLREKRKKTMAATKAEQEAGAKLAHDEETTTTEIHIQDTAVEKGDEDTHDVIHEEEAVERDQGDRVDEEEEDEEEDEEAEDEDEKEEDSSRADTGVENDAKAGQEQAVKIATFGGAKHAPLTPTDSGVVLDSSAPLAHLDETSETAQMESRADSPTIVSEAEHSTMASSLSELTNETEQAKDTKHQEVNLDQEICKDNEKQDDEYKGEEPEGPEARVAKQNQPAHSESDTHSSEPAAAGAEPNDPDQAETAGEAELAEDEETPKLMVPKSKFSTQDPASAPKGGSSSSSVIVSLPTELENSLLEESVLGKEEQHEVGAAEEVEQQETKRPPPTIEADMNSKVLGADDSDLADDNSSIQEAVLMPVSGSPNITSAPFPPSHAPALESARTVSNPLRGSLAVPAESSQSLMRSMSSGAAFLHKVHNRQQQQQLSSNTVIVKPIVGSSISQRIKALEKLSANSADHSQSASRDRPSSAFFAVPKRETSGSPSVADRTKSLKKIPAPAPPPGSTTTRNRSPSLTSQFSNKFSVSQGRQAQGDEPREALDSRGDDHDGESVISEKSVERDARSAKRSSMTMAKDFLKEHRKSATISADMQQVLSSAISTSRPSSSTQANNTVSSRLSISSRRSSINKDRDHALLMSAMAEDEKGNKAMSRTERFMRRLSQFPTPRGKGSVSMSSPSPVTEEGPDAASRRPADNVDDTRLASAGSEVSSGVVAEMGDVNVQFPDNLLWKRRNMCLDAQGFLILSASVQNGKAAAVGTKRYHLSEFRQPYAPDVEVQELPNSVVLDFVEGSGIQVACEDRSGQLNVLKVLREAHAGHSTFGK